VGIVLSLQCYVSLDPLRRDERFRSHFTSLRAGNMPHDIGYCLGNGAQNKVQFLV